MPDCHFHLSIVAPQGLVGFDIHLQGCTLPLTTTVSGYNGKTILKTTRTESWFEWAMDSSDTDLLVAHGYISQPVDEAWTLLSSLTTALTASGFPHKILLDNEDGHPEYSSAFLWDHGR